MDVPWVGANQRVGAYAATRYLILQGHRRIAHIRGPLRYQVSLDRYHGYCQALKESGLELDPDLILQGNFTPDSGKECANKLFARMQTRPTAIFAGNDLMAFGAFAAAEQHDLRIPEDVAIVGFDDISPAAHIQPPLTTVRQPLYEMGQSAIELLLRYIDDVDIAQNSLFPLNGNTHFPHKHHMPEHILLDTNLVVRESSSILSKTTA
jgi:LacI family transcriptional regulator